MVGGVYEMDAYTPMLEHLPENEQSDSKVCTGSIAGRVDCVYTLQLHRQTCVRDHLRKRTNWEENLDSLDSVN